MEMESARGDGAPDDRSRRRPRRTALELTERDRAILAFAADHRLVLAAHVAALVGSSGRAAGTRLGALSRAGYLESRQLFHQQPACYRVTAAGLAAVGSPLRRPGLDLECYLHDVGCAWLWLSARGGAFGRAVQVLSERQLRSRDARMERGTEPGGTGASRDGPLAVRLGGFGPGGREQLHYPDLLVRTPQARRIAIELELTGKGRRRRERILTGYGADRRFDAVVYLVNRPGLARDLRRSAAALGIAPLVHVQTFAWSPSLARLERQLGAGVVTPGRDFAGRDGAVTRRAEVAR